MSAKVVWSHPYPCQLKKDLDHVNETCMRHQHKSSALSQQYISSRGLSGISVPYQRSVYITLEKHLFENGILQISFNNRRLCCHVCVTRPLVIVVRLFLTFFSLRPCVKVEKCPCSW